MSQEELDEFFEEFLDQKSIFIDKQCLQANFTPSNIPHREDQIKQIASSCRFLLVKLVYFIYELPQMGMNGRKLKLYLSVFKIFKSINDVHINPIKTCINNFI